MRRNNTVRIIIIALILGWAVYQLYPTYKLQAERKQENALIAELQNYVRFSPDEIKEALRTGSLEMQVKASTLSGDSLQQAMAIVNKLFPLQETIAKNEDKAIKQGLDLQGGTYLVYEVDLPQLLKTLSKNRDAKFDSLLEEAQRQSIQKDEDFFKALQAAFQKHNVRLNRYLGRRIQTDSEVIDDLKKQAEDAVDRTLEVLRNRIDQFGVSEPSIAKQGSQRIVIELAGIQDVGRAKEIIGKTAQLEFKLLKDPAVFSVVLQDIDNVVKERLNKQDKTLATDSTAATSAKSTTATKETGLSSLFGKATSVGDTTQKSAAEDTSVLIEESVFQQNPFFSLLVPMGNQVAVPAKNLLAVQKILNMPEVRQVIPEDSEILFSSKPEESQGQQYYIMYLVRKKPELTGKYISNADVTISSGRQSLAQGQPVVSLTMDREGARIFARVTGANVNKFLAIVLDNKVSSAPRIDEKIPSGSAVIRGSFTMQEARDLAIVLRAGALPAPVAAIEERTVGPSLGQDSVRRGQLSIVLGIVLVILFMIVYYRMSGLIADVALILNLILIMAALAAFHATLTLPGVAGIILTIGMAVDANVLIFERIREELRTGKTVRAAIDAGYGRAFWTIFDANVTTFLTALVLYQFGTGPIRGFAVTLSIGILASMFTAIVVTRVIFDYLTSRRTMTKLSIG